MLANTENKQSTNVQHHAMSQALLSYSDSREVLHWSIDTKTETVFDIEHKGASSKQNWY